LLWRRILFAVGKRKYRERPVEVNKKSKTKLHLALERADAGLKKPVIFETLRGAKAPLFHVG
jgi:hypothetical protein